MRSKLREEIKQEKPFACLEQELWLNLSRTAATIGHEVETRLRPHGLSPTQYNVLRILRGAGPQGLCQYEISDRLVAQVPDVPRIIERMERAGWVKRERSETDRRVVIASLTGAGAELVDTLDQPMEQLQEGIFCALTEPEKNALNELLVSARKLSCTED